MKKGRGLGDGCLEEKTRPWNWTLKRLELGETKGIRAWWSLSAFAILFGQSSALEVRNLGVFLLLIKILDASSN